MTQIAEPLYSDFLAEKLGASQQKVMSLTVENRALKKRVESLNLGATDRERALNKLLTDVAADLSNGVMATKIERRIKQAMQELYTDA